MWRVLGLVLVMLVVGVGAGYVVAEATHEEPVAADRVEPVPAESPAYPTPPAVDVLPDPDTPPLEPGIPTERIRLRTDGGRGQTLFVDQPTGWRRHRLADNWHYAVAGNPVNTYTMRVGLTEGLHQSVAVAKAARIAAFEDAVANGDLENFTVESQTDDTLIATYVADDHVRLTMERWVAFGDSNIASAVGAVTGRMVDRTGLMDLLERTTASMDPSR